MSRTPAYNDKKSYRHQPSMQSPLAWLEGKTAACAHLSALDNIAAATCDNWNNEAPQNVKFLGGMAPTRFTKQLIYYCR
jgi:hypothetical protein